MLEKTDEVIRQNLSRLNPAKENLESIDYLSMFAV